MKTISKKLKLGILLLACSVGRAQTTTGDLLGDILTEAANSYKWNFELITPKSANGMKFSDQTITLEFAPMDEKQLTGPYNWAFWITNNTASNIEVNWEKSYITSLEGKQRSVYHGDMKSTSSSAQKNTVIAAKKRVGDALVPKESVVTARHDGHYDDNGKWVEPWNEITSYQVFFAEDFPADRKYETVKPACEGKQFQVRLAIVSGGALKNYDLKHKF
jgi:hypothetical protein